MGSTSSSSGIQKSRVETMSGVGDCSLAVPKSIVQLKCGYRLGFSLAQDDSIVELQRQIFRPTAPPRNNKSTILSLLPQLETH